MMGIVGKQTRPCAVRVDLDPITEGRMWIAEVEGSDSEFIGNTAREAVEMLASEVDGVEIDWTAIEALEADAAIEHAPKLIMDANGHYWRVYPEHLSMVPTTTDNEPVPKPWVEYWPDTAVGVDGTGELLDAATHLLRRARVHVAFDAAGGGAVARDLLCAIDSAFPEFAAALAPRDSHVPKENTP